MPRKLRKHGETFLTKPRWFTKDKSKAENSLFVWGASSNRTYTLSPLGVINGLLGWVRLITVLEVDTVTKDIVHWKIVKKWW